MATVKAVKRKHEGRLMSLPGVVGVGIGRKEGRERRACTVCQAGQDGGDDEEAERLRHEEREIEGQPAPHGSRRNLTDTAKN